MYLILPAILSSQNLLSLWMKWIPGIFLWGKVWPAIKADNLTTNNEPIVRTIRDSQHLTTLQASTACYRYSFNSFCFVLLSSKRIRNWSVETLSDLFVPLPMKGEREHEGSIICHPIHSPEGWGKLCRCYAVGCHANKWLTHCSGIPD
jgi:hypothetical protein